MNMIRLASSERRPSLEHKRRSFAKARHRTPAGAPPPAAAATFDFVIESPPLMFYGPPSSSTGALFSAQLIVKIAEHDLAVDGIGVRFLVSTTAKKPVHASCPDCATKTTELVHMELLKERSVLRPGRHAFPFSYLLSGHLPATSHGSLAVLDYKISAIATSSFGEKFCFEKVIEVQRAILPGLERTSTRIFPPTNLTAHIVLPPVAHPIGDFPVQIRLDRVVRRGPKMQVRWRLRKLTWRIEERSTMISTPCVKHQHKVPADGTGLVHHDTRWLIREEFKRGWKTDFSSGEGNIEMEFQAAIPPDAHPVCDVDSGTGFSVSHTLITELVVSEEFCPNQNTKLVTPTGAARILRLTFALLVTARPGLGISWDEEQPPIYSDVPPSPPSYATLVDYDGEPLEDDHELNSMSL